MYTVHGTYKTCTSTMYAHVHDIQVQQDRSIYYVQVLLYGHVQVPHDRSIHVTYKYRSINAYTCRSGICTSCTCTYLVLVHGVSTYST